MFPTFTLAMSYEFPRYRHWEKTSWDQINLYLQCTLFFYCYPKMKPLLILVFLLILLFCCSITVVPIFSPLLSPAQHKPHLPHSSPLPIAFCRVPLYMSLDLTLLFFPPLSSFLFPSGYCQFALYFHVSGSILLACLFCWLGCTYRWDHMVFFFHQLAF